MLCHLYCLFNLSWNGKWLSSYLGIALSLFPLVLFGQDTIRSSDYFSAVIHNPAWTTYQKSIQDLSTQNKRAPYLDDIEIRTETHEFDLDQQEYTLRVSPLTLAERKGQKTFQGLYLEKLRLEQLSDLQKQLRDAYRNWLNLYRNRREFDLEREWILLEQDRLNMLERQTVQTNFAISDLVEADDELKNRQLKQLELLGEGKILEEEIAGKQASFFTFDSLISILEMKALVNQSLLGLQNPELAIDALDQELSIAEYNLERAETRRIIDFAQLRYRGRNNNVLEEDLSVGLGFRFPSKGRQNLRLNELKIRAMREAHRLETAQTTYKIEVRRKTQELFDKIEQFEFYQDAQTRFVDKSLDAYAHVEGSSPNLLIKLKKLQLTRMEKVTTLHMKIYESYIEWLFVTGKLVQLPFRNYLSPRLELLK